MKLGPRSKTEVQLHYRQAKYVSSFFDFMLCRQLISVQKLNDTIWFRNYPLDLYYLMDLTWSMKDDKDTLVSLGWNMTDKLGMFTSNYRLGFGSYADKPLMPFIFPGHEDNPCKSEHSVCSPVYSFRHRLRLTDDIRLFVREVHIN